MCLDYGHHEYHWSCSWNIFINPLLYIMPTIIIKEGGILSKKEMTNIHTASINGGVDCDIEEDNKEITVTIMTHTQEIHDCFTINKRTGYTSSLFNINDTKI